MITTTLNRVRNFHPLFENKLLAHLGKTTADDEPLPFSVIVEAAGLDAALDCCRVEPQHAKAWRQYAIWCAQLARHLMTDPRSLTALDVAERYLQGEATDAELEAAWDGAGYAACSTAGYAAWALTFDEPWLTAVVAAKAAEEAVAEAAAGEAAKAEAREAIRNAQTKEFLRVVTETA